ncbi:MAG: hypothetical protein RIG62_06350 [Cyclobacteriaceae bacterium]
MLAFILILGLLPPALAIYSRIRLKAILIRNHSPRDARMLDNHFADHQNGVQYFD